MLGIFLDTGSLPSCCVQFSGINTINFIEERRNEGRKRKGNRRKGRKGVRRETGGRKDSSSDAGFNENK